MRWFSRVNLVAFLGRPDRYFYEPLPGKTEPLGNPGGARHVGPLDLDTELATKAADTN